MMLVIIFEQIFSMKSLAKIILIFYSLVFRENAIEVAGLQPYFLHIQTLTSIKMLSFLC